jgi:hypothetical protein
VGQKTKRCSSPDDNAGLLGEQSMLDYWVSKSALSQKAFEIINKLKNAGY